LIAFWLRTGDTNCCSVPFKVTDCVVKYWPDADSVAFEVDSTLAGSKVKVTVQNVPAARDVGQFEVWDQSPLPETTKASGLIGAVPVFVNVTWVLVALFCADVKLTVDWLKLADTEPCRKIDSPFWWRMATSCRPLVVNVSTIIATGLTTSVVTGCPLMLSIGLSPSAAVCCWP